MDFTPAEREVYALRDGDVVLAEASGSPHHVGRPAIWRDELPLCCMQNTIIRFRPHAVTPEYGFVVFRHYVESGVFARAARGSGLLHLGARRFGELTFPLPPLAEQERIVGVLDGKLAELRQARAALEAALIGTREQDWEILSAATTGRLPGVSDRAGAAVTTHPDNDPRDLVARHPIPEEWEWETVGSVGELTLGKALGPKARQGANMKPYLRVANVLEDRIDLSDLKTMAFSEAELQRYALRDRDVLLNDGQSPELVGRPAMYRGELPELYFQNHLIRFRASERIDPSYALLVFRHYLHAGEFRRLARGSTNIANLSQARLASMPFPVPSLCEQRQIVAEAQHRLDASRDQREAILASIEHGREIVTELLAAATAGQLVSQDSNDEPAQALLDRLGPPPPGPAPATAKMAIEPDRGSTPADAEPRQMSLASVLARTGGTLTVSELARAAEVDLNDVDKIELFYRTLRDDLGRSVQIVRGTYESVELGVSDPATH